MIGECMAKVPWKIRMDFQEYSWMVTLKGPCYFWIKSKVVFLSLKGIVTLMMKIPLPKKKTLFFYFFLSKSKNIVFFFFLHQNTKNIVDIYTLEKKIEELFKTETEHQVSTSHILVKYFPLSNWYYFMKMYMTH